MENDGEIFVGEIKDEPERHYVVIIPEPLEKRYQLRNLNIFLRKFDKRWKHKAEMFRTFYPCKKCDFVARWKSHLPKHLPACERNTSQTKNKLIYACAFCELEFSRLNSRKKHVSDDHRCGSQWQCSNCTCSLPKKTQLINHYRTCVKKFPCETCYVKYANQSKLKDHQMNHRHGIYATKPIIRINCDMCDSWFRTETGLYDHRSRTHNRIHCQCDICGKTFSRKSNISKHMQYHYKVPCPICQHMLSSHRLNEHIEQRHSSTAQYKCENCDKIFRTRKGLNSHKINVHKNQHIKCQVCNKTFKNNKLMKVHLSIHVKIPCPTCRHLVPKRRLKTHMKREHSSSTRVKCEVCSKSFSSKGSLYNHKSHKHRVVVECDCCNKTFLNKASLKKHFQNIAENSKISKIPQN